MDARERRVWSVRVLVRGIGALELGVLVEEKIRSI